MQLNGQNLVDVASVYPYYVSKGLSLELLRLCNSQEFRFIDGYGKGYFLMTQAIAAETATFTVGSRTVSLKVIDKLSLEHPNHSGGLLVYVTAEPKYNLSKTPVYRNYNVTIDKSVPMTGTVSSLVTIDPDCPKTLQEILDDILSEGFSLVYDSVTITPYDVNIDGMSVLQAIDYLCSIYGLLWTASDNTVYVWDLVDDISSGSSSGSGGPIGQIGEPINDIRYTKIEVNPTNINVHFPVYNYCRELPMEYYEVEEVAAGQGYNLNILDPFLPAVIDNEGATPRNTTTMDLQDRADLLIDNHRAIRTTIEYVVKHYFSANPLSTRPISLSEVYGDWGRGPRSIYRWIEYPYVIATKPESKARYAKNFVGTLASTYNGIVETIYVTPEFGLDGKIPPGIQPVRNLYNWDYGEVGWYIRVEWDCVNRRWIPITQEYECPTNSASVSSDASGSVETDPYPTPCEQ